MSTQQSLGSGTAPPLDPRLREILGGAAAVRLLTLVWSAVVLVIDGRSNVLDRPTRAFAILAVMTAWTATTGILVRNRASALVSPAVIGTDVALALVVSMADSWVYDGVHPQSFGSAWPIATVLSVGAIAGMAPGGIVGASTGVASLVGAALTDSTDGRWLANSGTILLGAIAGVVAGYVADRLRTADTAAARARAREEFARDLHDGVLQTLAVIQRRSDDATLVALARERDRELRAFIGGERRLSTDLIAALHRVAADATGRFDVAVDVVVIEAPAGPDGRHEAIAAAASEAITNAAKHASPNRITVCVDNDGEELTVSVTDDGTGFDPTGVTEGVGINRSIRGRVEEIGGTVQIRSRPGVGTEVELRVPT